MTLYFVKSVGYTPKYFLNIFIFTKVEDESLNCIVLESSSIRYFAPLAILSILNVERLLTCCLLTYLRDLFVILLQIFIYILIFSFSYIDFQFRTIQKVS